jgi:hypothetical protein
MSGCWRPTPGADLVVPSGQYVDRSTRADGRWRLVDRFVTTDLKGAQGRRRPVLG